MIGQLITVWEINEDGYLVPYLSPGYGTWADTTGVVLPDVGEPVIVKIEAPSDWWATQPEGSVLWTE